MFLEFYLTEAERFYLAVAAQVAYHQPRCFIGDRVKCKNAGYRNPELDQRNPTPEILALQQLR